MIKFKQSLTQNPTKTISLSFLMVLLFGSILLSLPICNQAENISFLNHLSLFYIPAFDFYGLKTLAKKVCIHAQKSLLKNVPFSKPPKSSLQEYQHHRRI